MAGAPAASRGRAASSARRTVSRWTTRGPTNPAMPWRRSQIAKCDKPKMDMKRALQLFGAGREKRIYAVPPHASVKSLDFVDHPFTVERWDESCAICGATDSFLDEVITDDRGSRIFVCSDTDYCNGRQAEQAAE